MDRNRLEKVRLFERNWIRFKATMTRVDVDFPRWDGFNSVIERQMPKCSLRFTQLGYVETIKQIKV